MLTFCHIFPDLVFKIKYISIVEPFLLFHPISSLSWSNHHPEVGVYSSQPYFYIGNIYTHLCLNCYATISPKCSDFWNSHSLFLMVLWLRWLSGWLSAPCGPWLAHSGGCIWLGDQRGHSRWPLVPQASLHVVFQFHSFSTTWQLAFQTEKAEAPSPLKGLVCNSTQGHIWNILVV